MEFIASRHERISSLPGVGSMVQQIIDLYTSKYSTDPSPNDTQETIPDTSSTHNDETFPFLALPRELRDQVYSYLYEPKDLITSWISGHNISHDQHITCPSILSTNRQLRAEFLSSFFLAATVQKYPLDPSMQVKHNMPDTLATLVRKVNFQEHKFGWNDWILACDTVLNGITKMPNLRAASVRWHHWGTDPLLAAVFQKTWQEHPLRMAPQLTRLEMTLGDMVGYDFRFCRAGQQWHYVVDVDYSQGRRIEWEDRKLMKWGEDGVETSVLDMNGMLKDKTVKKTDAMGEKDTLFVRLP